MVFSDDYQCVRYADKSIERTVFQNAIGPYITFLNLKKQGLLSPNCRVVFAGGEGARGIPNMIQKPVFSTPKSLNDYIFGRGALPRYNPMNAIGVSKFMSALLVQKLASLEMKSDFIWFSPGLTHGTGGLATISNPAKRFFMEKIVFGYTRIVGKSQTAQQGAQKYVDCLTAKIGRNGDVLGAPEGKVLGEIVDQKPMNPDMTKQDLIEEFWGIVDDTYSLPSPD